MSKNKIITIGVIIVIVVCVVMGLRSNDVSVEPENIPNGGVDYMEGVSVIESDITLPLGGSTSTPQTLLYEGAAVDALAYATSTFATYGTELMALNIQMKSSSTDAVLRWYYEYSDNNMDWFSDDTASTTYSFVSSELKHSSSTPIHYWKPQVGTTTVARKHIEESVGISKFMRIIFYTENATSSIFARIALLLDQN